ncbi:Protein HIM-4 a, partial [Aphelenchoides avenae]
MFNQRTLVNSGSCDSTGRRNGSFWSTVHNVTVATPARIRRSGNGNANIVATAGKTMRLPCILSGKSPFTVKWFIDGEPVVTKYGRAVEAKFRGVSVGEDRIWSNSHFLLRKNVSSRHEGTHRCEATNELGTDELTYSVKVKESPVEKHVIVAEGNEMTLNCSFTSKPAPLIPGRPVIRWLRKGIVVKTETNSTNESTYTIPKVTWADLGDYWCIATNAD